MKKFILVIILLLSVLLVFSFCGKDEEEDNTDNNKDTTNENASNDTKEETTSEKEKEETTPDKEKEEVEKTHIGLLVGGGGLGDNSFNDMQYRGLVEIQRKYPEKVSITYIHSEDNTEAYIEAFEKLINENKCKFIICSGWERIEALDKVSDKYPEVNFVLLDDFAVLKQNVSSIVFAQNEGSFVVGSLSAMMTETKKLGFVGGMDMLVIKDFLVGYQEGIKYIDPSIEVFVEYCGLVEKNEWDGWENPKKAKRLAEEMYEKGADIIYAVAGLSGNGVIEAAKQEEKYVIGVDSDQDYMAKGFILTSMMKRLDIAVMDICEKFIKGEFEGNKDYLYGYENGGVSITKMKYTRDKIPDEYIEKVREIEKKIKTGEIEVTRLLTRQN